MNRQDEDTGVLCHALPVMLAGKNVELVASDSDFLLIGMLMESEAFHRNRGWHQLGRIFIHRGVSASADSSHFAPRDIVTAINSDPRLAPLRAKCGAKLQVMVIVLLMIMTADDTNNSVFGVNHQYMLATYLEHCEWIGVLLQDASDDNSAPEGHVVTIDWGAFMRLWKVLTVGRRGGRVFEEKW